LFRIKAAHGDGVKFVSTWC